MAEHLTATAPAPTAPRVLPDSTRVLTPELVVLCVATLAVWGHTLDEIRIGEYIAVPFGLATLGLVVGWSGMRTVRRGWAALLLGLLWSLAVIPYHIVPLLEGVITWQNISGVLRVVGGVPMALLGLRELRRRGRPNAASVP
jgi:hypothetical protein